MDEPRSPYDRGWHTLESDAQIHPEQDATGKPGGGFRHTLAATQDDSLTVDVSQAGPFSWTLDEPQALGGRGSAPDPVTAFLGALCGCLLLSVQITARARRVPLAGATISARANEKGFVENSSCKTICGNAQQNRELPQASRSAAVPQQAAQDQPNWADRFRNTTENCSSPGRNVSSRTVQLDACRLWAGAVTSWARCAAVCCCRCRSRPAAWPGLGQTIDVRLWKPIDYRLPAPAS